MTRTKQRGSAILELMIGFAILTLALIGSAAIVFGGQTSALDTSLSNHGRFRMASELASSTASVLALWEAAATSTDIFDGVYTLRTIIRPITPCVKELSVANNWSSEHNRTQHMAAVTLVASTTRIHRVGGDCDPLPPTGNWQAPSIHPFNDPIFSGNAATDVDVIKRNDGRFAVVTTLHNPSPMGRSTAWLINTTDLEADPVSYASFASGGDLFAVDAIDTYAFATGASTTAQRPVQIFQITDTASLVRAAEASLPHAPTGVGRSIYYENKRLYVGTQYLPCVGCAPERNHELHIFNVEDPANPIWETSINVQRNVNDIVVRDGIAYLATGGGSDNTVLKLYDVNPLSPSYRTLIGELAASSSHAGTALYVLGAYAYLGRERTTSAHHDFMVISIRNPAAPLLVDSERLNLNSGEEVSGVVAKGDIAFITTTDTTPANGGGPFMLYNIADPAHIAPVTPCTPANWSEKASGMDMVDNLIFVANESNDALSIINPAPLCAP